MNTIGSKTTLTIESDHGKTKKEVPITDEKLKELFWRVQKLPTDIIAHINKFLMISLDDLCPNNSQVNRIFRETFRDYGLNDLTRTYSIFKIYHADGNITEFAEVWYQSCLPQQIPQEHYIQCTDSKGRETRIAVHPHSLVTRFGPSFFKKWHSYKSLPPSSTASDFVKFSEGHSLSSLYKPQLENLKKLAARFEYKELTAAIRRQEVLKLLKQEYTPKKVWLSLAVIIRLPEYLKEDRFRTGDYVKSSFLVDIFKRIHDQILNSLDFFSLCRLYDLLAWAKLNRISNELLVAKCKERIESYPINSDLLRLAQVPLREGAKVHSGMALHLGKQFDAYFALDSKQFLKFDLAMLESILKVVIPINDHGRIFEFYATLNEYFPLDPRDRVQNDQNVPLTWVRFFKAMNLKELESLQFVDNQYQYLIRRAVINLSPKKETVTDLLKSEIKAKYSLELCVLNIAGNFDVYLQNYRKEMLGIKLKFLKDMVDDICSRDNILTEETAIDRLSFLQDWAIGQLGTRDPEAVSDLLLTPCGKGFILINIITFASFTQENYEALIVNNPLLTPKLKGLVLNP